MTEHTCPQPIVDEIDLRSEVDLVEIVVALDALSSQINTLWSLALAKQDFDEVTRLVEASHAIHRAALALEIDDSLIPRAAGARDLTP